MIYYYSIGDKVLASTEPAKRAQTDNNSKITYLVFSNTAVVMKV